MYNVEKLKERYKRISASSLSFFEVDPKYFKNYIDGLLKEDSASYFELGTQLHMFILEPDEFKKKYTYLDVKKPSGEKQKEFCRQIVESKLKDEQGKIVNAYKLTYTVAKKSEEKIKLEALKLFVSLKGYVDYLKKSKEYKAVLSKSTFNYLQEADYQAKHHVAAKDLVFDEDSFIDKPGIYTANELLIYWEHPSIEFLGEPLVCKSIIDRLYIDHEKKIIKLIDLKTSSNLHDFKHSYDTYSYNRQMAFYWMSLYYYFKKEFPDKDINEYKKETFIVSFQTPNHFGKDYPIRCKVFPIPEEDLERGAAQIESLLNEIEWHMTEDKWDHSRSYYENNGLEKNM